MVVFVVDQLANICPTSDQRSIGNFMWMCLLSLTATGIPYGRKLQTVKEYSDYTYFDAVTNACCNDKSVTWKISCSVFHSEIIVAKGRNITSAFHKVV